MARIAILASGGGSTAEAIICACRDGRIPAEPAVIIGNNSGAEVFARAARLQVPARHLSGHTHPDAGALDAVILACLRETGVTHVVLAGYLKKLGPLTLSAFAGRIVNTHPALLPAFGGRGMYGARVHQAVLEAGARFTGATVHHVTVDYDAGPVIAQVQVPVHPGDTVDTLAARVHVAECDLLVSALASLIAAGEA
ncbi:MAG: phosphoribosylglycinamide formyltransferase [Frankiaceae bacterium]|nr:phosphoribosylglycinamide formyltransferase [Frankiaceae bacterium]